jgi:acyl-CoA thioester hydrolase
MATPHQIIEDIAFYHIADVQIRLNDIDINGHVNNVIYGHYFSVGRFNYVIEIFSEPLNWKNESLLMAHAETDFFKPIFMNEPLAVLTKITKIGNKSITWLQYIINKNTKEIKAKNLAVMVFFDNTIHQSVPVPDRWRKLILTFEYNQ